MSGRYVYRDPTAEQGAARADKGRGTKFHARGCWTNGRSGRHGINGFYCAKCAPESDPEERVVKLLTQIDSKAGGRW